MAGLGFVGAGGAAGTYEGLADWMRGRRQKVVQGQRDEDRLREQALQNQALATEAADREAAIVRQRILDDRAGTTFQNQQTTFGRETEQYNKDLAAEATAQKARAALVEGIRNVTDPRVTDIIRMVAIHDAQTTGKVSPLMVDALKTVEPEYDIAPNGDLINKKDPKNLGRNFAAPVRPAQSADDIIPVTSFKDGKEVTTYMRESAAAAHGPFEQAPAKGAKPPTIPAKQQEGLIGADSGEKLLNQMADLYAAGAKNHVGPLSGTFKEGKQWIGADKDENWAKFIAASSTIESDIIRAVTGAAVGKTEEVRIVRQIPRPWDQPVQWEAKLQQSLDNLQQLRAGTYAQIERAKTHAAGGDISDGLGQTPVNLGEPRGAGAAAGGSGGGKRDPLGIR